MRSITAQQLAEWLSDAGRPSPRLLDVRETWEYELCHLPDSEHVPMAAIPAKAPDLDPDAPTVVVCHHGVRSAQVGMYLERAGFSAVFNLAGGVDAWSMEVDPSMRRY